MFSPLFKKQNQVTCSNMQIIVEIISFNISFLFSAMHAIAKMQTP